jgi:uncharacterized protein (TIGR00255 family)
MSTLKAPIRSMTGYARVRRFSAGGELIVSVKSLNHRGLDIHFHTASSLDPFENAMRTMVKRHLTRGHIEVRVSPPKAQTNGAAAINQPLLAAYFSAYQSAAAQYGVKAEPDLNAAFRLPGIFGEGAAENDDIPESVILDALDEALSELNEFRAREGADMLQVIRVHNANICNAALLMEEIRARAVPAFQNRLNERLRDLLRGTAIEPQRLAQEAAILADRGDIGEELTRLKIHSAQLETLVAAGGEVGKKLDFLLQEMNRESNTVLSKTTGIGDLGLKITELALAAKSDIEKIREQALNIE